MRGEKCVRTGIAHVEFVESTGDSSAPGAKREGMGWFYDVDLNNIGLRGDEQK